MSSRNVTKYLSGSARACASARSRSVASQHARYGTRITWTKYDTSIHKKTDTGINWNLKSSGANPPASLMWLREQHTQKKSSGQKVVVASKQKLLQCLDGVYHPFAKGSWLLVFIHCYLVLLPIVLIYVADNWLHLHKQTVYMTRLLSVVEDWALSNANTIHRHAQQAGNGRI
jgi:hypothetical protein